MCELAARPRLEPADQRRLELWLQGNPSHSDTCDQERALSSLLRELPRPTLSSNFTARVLEAVRLEASQSRAAQPRSSLWTAWLHRLRTHPALASGVAVALAAGVLSLAWLNLQTNRRLEMARSVADVAAVASLLSTHQAQPPHLAAGSDSLTQSVAVLRDFEAIARLRPNPAVDTELLAALR